MHFVVALLQLSGLQPLLLTKLVAVPARRSELEQVLRRHQRWVRDCGGDLRGRIYLSTQGINAQYSGEVAAAHAYAQWVGQQPGFEVSPCLLLTRDTGARVFAVLAGHIGAC